MPKAFSGLRLLYKTNKLQHPFKNFKAYFNFQVKPPELKIDSGKLLGQNVVCEESLSQSPLHKTGLLTKLVLGLGLLIPVLAVAEGLDEGKQDAAQLKGSSFEGAATKLGFNSASKQEALLKIFYYAGYLDPQRLWADLNRIDGIKDHAREAFELIYPALLEAHANQGDAKQFHPELLRAKLFEGLNEQEGADLLLYIAQHAFNRKLGQERNELISQNWMNEHKVEYNEAARVLGLIDRVEPSYKEYDAGWIAGSSRIGVFTRVIDYFNTISSKVIIIKGETSVLAGGRELWAEIDGIIPEVLKKLTGAAKSGVDMDLIDISLPASNNEALAEEGKKYIVELAKRHNIPFNHEVPLIKCATKAECLSGREPNRWYLNSKGKELTESLMSQDILKSMAVGKGVKIVDTKADARGARPDTVSTVVDAVKMLVAKIKTGECGDQHEFFILFESNQPYIERQTLGTQAAVNKVLKESGLKALGYTIKVDGVGFGNKQDVAKVHSEFAALMSEKMKTAFLEDKIPEHDLKPLLFQTRDSDKSVPDYPHIENGLPIYVDLGGRDAAVAE